MSRQLYDAERHESLGEWRWDTAHVKKWLHTWSQSAHEHWQKNGAFPLHPNDAEEADKIIPSGLYYGSFGVWLALEHLSKAGYGLAYDDAFLKQVYTQIYEQYCKNPDTGERVPSWFLGESSLLTRLCMLETEPTAHYKSRLSEMLEANLENPTQEILWGAPGTFLAALFMWESTLDSHWKALCQKHIDTLFNSWQWFDEEGAWMWKQNLYGKERIFIGAGHGWASNLYGLWRAQSLLNDTQYNHLRERTLSGIKNFALSHAEDATQTSAGAVNWPAVTHVEDSMLLQWCHGAPGMITALHHADLPEMDVWLYKGGLSILEAGPLKKGSSLCHGTGGNGYALLYLHQRFQQPKRQLPAYLPPLNWLQRAQQFAMHGLSQAEDAKNNHGDWRYSLWTGDAGLACFLMACLDPAPHLPGIDHLV